MNPNKKRPKLKGFQTSKGLYLKKQNLEDEILILGYEIYSNFFLLLIPTLFVLFDFTFLLLDDYKDVPYNSIKDLSYHSFSASLGQFLSNYLLVSMILFLIAIEIIYVIFIFALVTKWYVLDFYRRYLFSKRVKQVKSAP